MADIIFYEKTGCGGNARQKKVLESKGFTLTTESLLDYPWTAETLRPFFGELPVTEWFNEKAPAVKTGEVVPSTFNEESALEIMVENPILIHRPLMEYDGKKSSGFSDDVLEYMFGFGVEKNDLEQCQHTVKECVVQEK